MAALALGSKELAERVQDVVSAIALPPEQLTQEFKARACTALAPWDVPRRWVAAGSSLT